MKFPGSWQVFYSVWVVFVLLVLTPSPALAQTFPNGPIRLIYPFTAGSGGDIATRVTGAEVEKILGQPVVVENRPGGMAAAYRQNSSRCGLMGHAR